mmetsp:Transcript_19701/g.62663  ORF Transcript_19701/g.62663 Transcript_19701/m.62663 type:complete len:304 (+) Transcript_19701:153-1064(+)
MSALPPKPKGKRSAFGAQTLSQKHSAPSFGFGSSTRDSFERTYISPEHAKKSTGHTRHVPGSKYEHESSLGQQAMSNHKSSENFKFGTGDRLSAKYATGTPGPGSYKVVSSVTKQVDSTKESGSNFNFGSSTRGTEAHRYISADHAKSAYGKNSPGPSAYSDKNKAAIGIQVESRSGTSPQWRFGSSERFQYDYVKRATELPGAGQYNVSSALGKQSSSKKKTDPTWRFGTSTRDKEKNKFISVDHEKVMYGTNSPGPGTANQTSMSGRQPLAVNQSAPTWSFGQAKRLQYNINPTPGPGAYD